MIPGLGSSERRPSDPTLALVTIARDEERCIARLLRSVRDHVDVMVVVDTGSFDATVDIAREQGAQVHHVPWADDFSHAKNAALAKVAADYSLVLDADEWVIVGGDRLRQWVRAQATPHFGSILCESTFDGGTQCVRDRLIRVLPRGAVFEGNVHEQPSGPYPCVETPLVVGHDGYESGQMKHKRGRNERLLVAGLNRSPENAYLWYQLGCAREIDGRFAEAVVAFEKALPAVGIDSPQRHPLVCRYLRCLGEVGRFGEAVACYQREMNYWAECPDLHFVMSDVFLTMALAHPERAAELLPIIRRLLLRSLEIGERPDLPGAVAGRGSWSARHNLSVYDETARALFASQGVSIATVTR